MMCHHQASLEWPRGQPNECPETTAGSACFQTQPIIHVQNYKAFGTKHLSNRR